MLQAMTLTHRVTRRSRLALVLLWTLVLSAWQAYNEGDAARDGMAHLEE